MSADPNSFQDTNFQGPTFEVDYGRTGPDVHGNTLANNSINGLFIRIRTNNGSILDPLTVSARLTTTDMIYVLEENLIIQGSPGGDLVQTEPTPLGTQNVPTARPNARLLIDPGVIIKSSGSRIEADMGGELIAEGTLAQPIIFTSLFDSRYGAGGSFNTNNSSGTTAKPGDWGGIYFGNLSIGSIADALITFAGGSTSIEGGFATFDAVEIHQANVRIADSTLEDNAVVGDSSDRNGRTFATPAVIFISGAQPVIVNNIIQNNDSDVSSFKTMNSDGTVNIDGVAAAISANVNALNDQLVTDWGRSTGPIQIDVPSLTNRGPLIQGNELVNNPINGLFVRGGTIDTDVVFDDTDIVHVVEDTITTSNEWSQTGTIKLESTSTQSLVVKLLGALAGFDATGTPLDINDRVGGALQIIGTPNHPVILTSLYDTSVGGVHSVGRGAKRHRR